MTRWLVVTIFATAGYLIGGCNATDIGGVAPEGFVNLNPINFTNDVPGGQDPASLSIGGGTVTFSGGTAGTLGIPPLYFNDLFSWDFAAGQTSTITFDGLDVRKVRFYFAHSGNTGSTLRAEDVDGNAIGTADSFAATSLGDTRAIVEIDAGTTSIARLVTDVPAGAVVALDQLVLTVPQ